MSSSPHEVSRVGGEARTDQLEIELDSFPTAVRPMRAVPTDAPFSSAEYFFEVKWDGIRTILFVDPDGVMHLHDRGLSDLTAAVPELAGAAGQLPRGSILDGELVAADEDGRPDPALLRRRLAGGPKLAGEIPLALLAFDLLYLDGKPLLKQPLYRRKNRLARSVAKGGQVFVPEHIEGDGAELFEACLEHGLEGVVAKHRESPYVPGRRSPFWLTVKAVKSDNFVVIGATEGHPFGALLVAYWEDGRLLPCGSVGGGYDGESAQEIAAALDRLRAQRSPLQPEPILTGSVRWVRPELVINVRYSEWSRDGTLRFPIFNGIRAEVHATECIRNRPRVVIEGRARPGTQLYSITRFPF